MTLIKRVRAIDYLCCTAVDGAPAIAQLRQYDRGDQVSRTRQIPVRTGASSPGRDAGTLDQAHAAAAAKLQAQPEVALTSAETILKRSPGLPHAELIACQALRRMGDPKAA